MQIRLGQLQREDVESAQPDYVDGNEWVLLIVEAGMVALAALAALVESADHRLDDENGSKVDQQQQVRSCKRRKCRREKRPQTLNRNRRNDLRHRFRH